MRQHRQQFFALSTIGEQQNNIIAGHDPKITMECIQGVEVEGHQANRCEGGSNLAGDDAALAHTRDHQLGALIATPLKQRKGCLALFLTKPRSCAPEGFGLLMQHFSERVHQG